MYQYIHVPKNGEKITVDTDGRLVVPNQPIVTFIQGDGVGEQVTPLMCQLVDLAVDLSYAGQKKIHWMEIFNGEKAAQLYDGDWFPQETLAAISEYLVVMKGPLTTAVGAGFRSLNVALRHEMDLFVQCRPICYLPPLDSPLKAPEKIDMVVFRDNSEDVYSGIEFKADSVQAQSLLDYLQQELGVNRFRFTEHCGVGIKHISKQASQRVAKAAFEYALKHKRHSVTVVHKGDVMKFTEGAFVKWALELARDEYDATVDEHSMQMVITCPTRQHQVIIKNELIDVVLQNSLLTPEQYDVIAVANQHGDLLVDALCAQVGQVSMSPAAHFGEQLALFEPTHGTCDLLVGQDSMNPISSFLSGAMMLSHLGWQSAAHNIIQAISDTLHSNVVTENVSLNARDAEIVGCHAFTQHVMQTLIKNIKARD